MVYSQPACRRVCHPSSARSVDVPAESVHRIQPVGTGLAQSYLTAFRKLAISAHILVQSAEAARN